MARLVEGDQLAGHRDRLQREPQQEPQGRADGQFTGDGEHGSRWRATEELVRDLRLLEDLVPSVEYGIYQEFGTVHQPGKPYLTPAVQRVTGDLEGAFSKVCTDE